MVATQTTFQSVKSIAGTGLLALGLLILFTNLDGVTVQLKTAAGISPGVVGILPALGLAGMRILEEYTFHHEGFLSGIQQILVSFWPLILVAIGAGLLRSAFSERLRKSAGVATSRGEGACL
jgi:hypothetical protein